MQFSLIAVASAVDSVSSDTETISQGLTRRPGEGNRFHNGVVILLSRFPSAPFLLSLLIALLAYSLFMANKTMPISEGWYTEYAYLVNSGKVPYRDFALLFPPFYVYLVAGFTRMFGYSILALRVLGALVFTMTGVLMYLITNKVFRNRSVALVSSTAASFYLQASNGEIFYDYIYIFGICTYLSIYLALIALDHKSDARMARRMWSAVICGMFISFALLTKQSTGLIMLVFYPCLFTGVSLCRRRAKDCALLLGGYCMGAFLALAPFVLFLIANQAFPAFIASSFGQAASAKGGIVVALFSWLPKVMPFVLAQLPLTLLVLVLTAHFQAFGSADQHAYVQRRGNSILVPVLCSSTCLLAVLILYQWESLARFVSSYYQTAPFMYASFTLVVALFVGEVAFCIKRALDHVPLSWGNIALVTLAGASFCIAWGVGMSGGLATSQTALPFALMASLPLSAACRSRRIRVALACALLFMVVTVGGAISYRYTSMYSWWGLEAGSVWEQIASANVPLLGGIKMSPATASAYEKTYAAIEENVPADGTIFCFPHCPIFYRISDRDTDAYTRVQWFDVSSLDSIDRDIATLAAEKPDALVICKLPEVALNTHEQLFSTYQTRKMQDWLLNLAGGGSDSYRLVSTATVPNGYDVLVYVRQ